ncbi:paeninodin family lasso peptide [Bacillus sp. ISL-37]|nr:paeninodin family lasso peptide [Bacillus sp. ISL-37]MBT2686191.1 paeninodin family lasso peptide [Bacillus sp. ISL-37]
MKKEWNAPLLEVLEISQTMLGSKGKHLDNDFVAGTSFDDLTFS